VSFVGNTEAGTQFRDKMRDRDAEGNMLVQYNAAVSFVTRNLKTAQVEKEFNTPGQLEVPIEVFVELLTNAFIHRDYYVNSPIRLFIFDNRIEIHSPGILPDGVTEESIKLGISVPRNKLLFENAKDILPYTGIGSGIMRAMQNYDKILFKNDFEREEFITTIVRDDIPKNEGVNTANEAINEAIKKELTQLLLLISENPMIKRSSLEQMMGKSNATIERYLKMLKENELIEYIGSNKRGGYKIKE
jgi:predicted HTH transcriptional regulator